MTFLIPGPKPSKDDLIGAVQYSDDLRIAAGQDCAKLDKRAALKRDTETRALSNISSVLQSSDAGARAAQGESCPVYRCFRVLGQNSGYPVVLAKVRSKAPAIERFAAICKASRLRYRQIILSTHWWENDHGDFLALAKDGALIALVRQGRYYLVYDDRSNRLVRFRPVMAEDWAAVGYVVYPPLAAHIHSGWDIIKRIASYCRTDMITLLSLSAVTSILALGTPIAMAFLVGTIIPAQDQLGLMEFGIILASIALTSLLLSIITHLTIIRIEGRAGTLVQSAAIDRVLRLPATFFRKYSTGELVQRTMSITRLERMLTAGLLGGFLAGLFSLLSGLLMIYYAPQLALIPVMMGAMLVGISAWFGRLQVRADRAQMATSGLVSSTMFEMASGIEKLRLAAAEAPIIERWSRAFVAFQTAVLNQKTANAWMNMADTVLVQTCVLMVFVYAGTFLDLTKLPTPYLIAFISSLVAFLAGLRQLINTAVHISTLKPIYEYAAPIFEEALEADTNGRDPGVLKGNISLSNVRFSYRADGPLVLNGLDLKIQAGEYVALVGDSGCGKSTILRQLLGFETPQFGSVAIDGLDIQAIDKLALRRQFGVVMQSANLFPGTLYDNIVGANHAIPYQDVLKAVERVGLADDVHDMPMGLQTTLSDATGGLSGGQVQRVLLAKAIVASPRILILDEATSALDNRTQSLVTQTLQGLDATRIVVAHRLSTIIATDRIVVLGKGRVIEQGSYAELIAQNGHFSQLAKRQLL